MKLLPALLLLAITSAVRAQDYPTRPVRLVVGLGPGGGSDTIARLLTTRLTDMLGQSFVVDNRPSAGGIIAIEIVAKSAPDGYTLLMAFPSHPVNPSLHAELPYDTLRDFVPVTMVTSVTQVLLVNPKVPVNSVKELIAQAKDKPGQFNHGAVGRGSLGDLCVEVFSSMADVRIAQITYKGAPQVMTALIGGELQLYFSPPVVALPQMKAGRVRALATTGATRMDALPEVPTTLESGYPDSDYTFWMGVFMPAKTPPEIVAKFHSELRKALEAPAVKAKLATLGVEAMPLSSAEFDAQVKKEFVTYTSFAKAAGLTPAN